MKYKMCYLSVLGVAIKKLSTVFIIYNTVTFSWTPWLRSAGMSQLSQYQPLSAVMVRSCPRKCPKCINMALTGLS